MLPYSTLARACLIRSDRQKMKALATTLVLIVCSGCSHVVQREISVFPKVESRAASLSERSGPTQTLSVGGVYLQVAVLRFMIDDSSVAYVNDRLAAEGLDSLEAVRLIDFGFYTKTEVLSLPIGRETWFARIAVELRNRADGVPTLAKADVQIDVPPAQVFLGPASTDKGIDKGLLGESMSGFVADKFRIAATELVAKLKRPIQIITAQRASRVAD